MRSLFRSTAFRIALVFATALTLTTYAVFALVYLQVYTGNVALVRSVLQDEAAKARDAPVERLKRQLELRLTQDLRHIDYVGLYDASGHEMFGNIAADLRVPVDGTTHLIRTPPPQPEAWQSENAVFVAERRADGGKLVLGRSLVYVDQLAGAMQRAFAAAIAPVIVLALVIGTIVSMRALRRLTTIQEAITRVMQGELDVRLPARGSPDDIDELVRAVNRMLDEIVRLLEQIRSVGDNIAHDLRAPLAVMRARLERGLAGASEPELRRLTGEALADLQRAMTTVTALLRISELESGLRRKAFAPLDLAEVCREAYELFEPLGEAKGLAMTLDAAAPVPLSGDRDLLREAVANLVENAIKFTPSGGAVTVECGRDGTLVRVRDTGPGVPSEERDKILKRFYRADATSAAPGAGLGLSMAATIVELHGLALRVGDAAPGAVFAIRAPIVAAGSHPPDLKRNLISAFPRTS